MSGVNKIIVIGHIGQDADVKTTRNGNKIVNLSIATSESWRDKNDGERRERTQWHRVVVFNESLVEEAGRLKKGTQVYVEGQMEYRVWEADDGKKYIAEIVLRPFKSNLHSLPKGGGGGGAGLGQDDYDYDGGGTKAGDTREPGSKPAREFDDDIPF